MREPERKMPGKKWTSTINILRKWFLPKDTGNGEKREKLVLGGCF
jgi:hypothetical protein